MNNHLITRLDKVRQTGAGKYIACCPAHLDKSPSLSIKETESGKILVHCFAGCDYKDVLAAVGLHPTDLFPDDLHRDERIQEAKRRAYKERFDIERLIVAQVEHKLELGEELSAMDCKRGLLAIERLFKIGGAING